MKFINQYTKFIPYLYFVGFIAYWFTDINGRDGLSAYPILLFGIPFLWQIIKPNRKLNFTLGITFVCLSSYLILAYIFDTFSMITLSSSFKKLIIYSGFFVITNFIMALWIIKNSLNRSF